MKLRRAAGALALAMTLWVPPAAWAAGGAHVVDDAAVEEPGHCHVDAWATRLDASDTFASLSPACTFRGAPRLEVGGFVQRTFGADDAATLVGPGFKLVLHAHGDLSLALTGAAAWEAETGRPDSFAFVAPVSWAPSERLQLNLNVGLGKRPGEAAQAIYGAQIEHRPTDTVLLMIEVFGRSDGAPGAQTGVRWTPKGGALDFDLLVGHRVMGDDETSLSAGLTWRP